MRIDVLTLFPDMIAAVLRESVIGRAVSAGVIDLRVTDIREFSTDRHKKTDDYPYGGGGGMVMTPQPLYDAWLAVSRDGAASYEQSDSGISVYTGTDNCDCQAGSHGRCCIGTGAGGGRARAWTIYMSPQGATLTQRKALELSREARLIIVCGHYEGADERAIELIADEEISIGDYVLTGGEIPAMALIDCVARLVPGVLSSDDMYKNESHYSGALEYPQYTRPASFMGKDVPGVLLTGDHDEIEQWRREEAYRRTARKRPDLWSAFPRRLATASAANMRDLGGYPAAGGLVTRWRVFIRSDYVAEYAPQDMALLSEMGLAAVIDLRSATEVREEPNPLAGAAGVGYYNIPMLTERAIEKSMQTAPFKELYILFAERGSKKIAKAFSIMAKCGGLCIINCHAGTDRTGIIAALLLSLAGVANEDVIADYEISGAYFKSGASDSGGADGGPDKNYIFADRVTIKYFLSHIGSKYGSAENFLLKNGLPDREISMLKAKFLGRPR